MSDSDGVVLADFLSKVSRQWWRLRRDTTGAMQLDTINEHSLARRLAWVCCGPVVDERIGSSPTREAALAVLLEAVVRYIDGDEAALQHRAEASSNRVAACSACLALKNIGQTHKCGGERCCLEIAASPARQAVR